MLVKGTQGVAWESDNTADSSASLGLVQLK